MIVVRLANIVAEPLSKSLIFMRKISGYVFMAANQEGFT